MAEEALRATNSTGTVKSRCHLRRNSLPLFPSDLGKDVPSYLTTSTSSCHDYCKYGRKETLEIKQTRPGTKRLLAVSGLKASDKPKPRQDDPVKIRKPWILPDDKTPKASSKQNVPREKDTKASEGAPKSVKSMLLRENSIKRKSAPTSGHEKIKIQKEKSAPTFGHEKNKIHKEKSAPTSGHEKNKLQKEIVPESGNSEDAKTNSKGIEGRKLTKPVKGPSTNAAVQQNAKAMPPSSSSPTPLKMATRLKPLSSSPPHRVRPVTTARPQSSPTPLKIATRLKLLSSSSPSHARPMTKARPQSPPTQLKPVSLRSNSLSSPGSLKLKQAVKKSPQAIPPLNVSSKKTINIKSQIAKKGKSSKLQATEAVASRRRSVSSNSEVAANFDKNEFRQESLGEAEIPEKKELFENNEGNSSHETLQATEAVATRCDSVAPDYAVAGNSDTRELQQENLVESEVAEKKELFEKNEEDSGHETDLQNQESTESYDDEVPEKTLYVVKMETGNENQPPSNAEEEIADVQPLASLSPPQSPSSPNENQPAAKAEEEIADMQPLASLSPPLLPSSPISVTVPYIATQTDASLNELGNTDTAVPCTDQETPDMLPLPSLSPAISPKSQSSITASNDLSHYEVSMDGSICSENEDGYSSFEDEHLIDGEDLKGAADNIKVKKVSRVTSQDDDKDPVKLRFRRGRVIEIAQENHGPRRLKFRRVKVRDDEAAKDFVRKSSFKITEQTQVNATTDNSAGSVVLRHQDLQDKKDAQGLLNNVIEETASKLVEKRRSMVKALVGAFETVILLQDGKPAATQQDS